MGLILPAVPFTQRRIQMYIAVVSPSDLAQFSIDTWDWKNAARKRGYQRELDEDRIKKIARYFERRDAIMPVAGLLNIRERRVVRFSGGKLTIPNGTHVWVVDMQHRLNGILRAKEHHLLGSDFRFPVVITEGLSQMAEAAQFYLINTRAKRMDVALTRRLLIERGMIQDIADVRPWEIRAVQATIILNTELRGNPWYHAIRQPNEEKLISHIATEKSFVSSLRQLFLGESRKKRARFVAKQLEELWTTIEAGVPEAFEDPGRYLIQRTPGMFAFNFFLAPIVLGSPRSRSKLLRGLRDLGPAFWRRTTKAGARRFGTGMSGYANLADHLKVKFGL